MEGTGTYLVTAVGLSSQTGIIFKLLGATKKEKKGKISLLVVNYRLNTFLNIEKKDDSTNDSFEKSQINSGNRTVLQTKLQTLSIRIGYMGLKMRKIFFQFLLLNLFFEGILAAFVTFVILCVRLAVAEFINEKNPWSNTYLKYISSYLVQAVTVVVVAVPEGLPLAVTLSLAFAVRVSKHTHTQKTTQESFCHFI
jgi:Ca2+ transporting ATPase